jgi:S1-C subfamily serine protease
VNGLRRIATWGLLGAVCTACTTDQKLILPSPAPAASQPAPTAVAEPLPTLPSDPDTSANKKAAQVPLLQSVYFVVATRRGQGARNEGSNRGVAFAYKSEGADCLLITASHVVQDAQDVNVYQLTPELSTGTGYEARVKWIDAGRDVAALQIPESAACAPLPRSSDSIPLGHRVTAVLHTPMARGMITSGIVGAHWQTEVGPTIVSDMRVYPGHSGSPLLDPLGRVIGMVLSRALSSEMSATFALPTSAIEAAFEVHNSAPATSQLPMTTAPVLLGCNSCRVITPGAGSEIDRPLGARYELGDNKPALASRLRTDARATTRIRARDGAKGLEPKSTTDDPKRPAQ